MKKRLIMFFVVLTLLIATTCLLTACNGTSFKKGGSEVDIDEIVVEDGPNGHTETTTKNRITAKYFLGDGAYIELRGEKADKMSITGYVGEVTDFKLAEIEQNVKADGKAISVNSIAPYAFFGCQSIANVDLTKFNESIDFIIGDNAFSNCPALTSVKLPDKVYVNENIIGMQAFANNKLLATVENLEKFPCIYDQAFYNDAVLNNITLSSKTKYLTNKVFAECPGLSTVNLNEGIQYIAPRAFENSAISSIDFSKLTSLRYIGENAFKNNQLSDINLPDSLSEIHVGAFLNNPLKTVNVPYLGKTIVDSMPWNFNDTYGLEKVDSSTEGEPPYYPYYSSMDLTVRSSANIDNVTLNESNVKNVNITKMNVTDKEITIAGLQYSNGRYYFATTIENVSFENDMLELNIPNSAFKDCKFLESVTIPEVDKIGSHAFENDLKLVDISGVLTSSVQFVGSMAFANTAITDVVVPSSVTVDYSDSWAEGLGANVFYNCGELKSLTLDFANLKNQVVGGYNSYYHGIAYYLGAKEYPGYGDFKYYDANGVDVPLTLTKVVLNNAYKVPENFLNGFKMVDDVTVNFYYDDDITVGANAFNSTSISDITPYLNEKTYSIGNGAFYNTNITTVDIPAHKNLGRNFLGGNEKLAEITIHEFDVYPYDNIVQNYFDLITAEAIKTVNMAEDCSTTIPANFFAGMSGMTKLNGVIENIKENAFVGCVSMPTYDDAKFVVNGWLIDTASNDMNIVIDDKIVGYAVDAVPASVKEYFIGDEAGYAQIKNGSDTTLKTINYRKQGDLVFNNDIIYEFVKKNPEDPATKDMLHVLSIDTKTPITKIPGAVKVNGVDVPVTNVLAHADYQIIPESKTIVEITNSIVDINPFAFMSSTSVYYSGTQDELNNVTGGNYAELLGTDVYTVTYVIKCNGNESVEAHDLLYYFEGFKFPEEAINPKMSYDEYMRWDIDPASFPYRMTSDVTVYVEYTLPELKIDTYGFALNDETQAYEASNDPVYIEDYQKIQLYASNGKFDVTIEYDIAIGEEYDSFDIIWGHRNKNGIYVRDSLTGVLNGAKKGTIDVSMDNSDSVYIEYRSSLEEEMPDKKVDVKIIEK